MAYILAKDFNISNLGKVSLFISKQWGALNIQNNQWHSLDNLEGKCPMSSLHPHPVSLKDALF